MGEFEARREQILERVEQDIATYGWHIVAVYPREGDEEAPQVAFQYTIGLGPSYSHPELVIVGLSHEATTPILHGLVQDRIAAGERMKLFERDKQVLAEHDAMFLPVPRSEYENWFGVGLVYYQAKVGRALVVEQLVWPSPDNLFPWQMGTDPTFKERQVIFCPPLKGAR